jgi:hypothetical protein
MRFTQPSEVLCEIFHKVFVRDNIEMEEVPEEIKLGEKAYYKAEDLKSYDPAYFYGCSSIRRIIAKQKIEPSQYAYAMQKKNVWNLTANQAAPPTRSTLMLLAEWVVANVPKMQQRRDFGPSALEDGSASASQSINASASPEAPPLLHLEPHEKFKNADGKIFELETRGSRTAMGVYFLGKDVAAAFEMPNLIRNMKDKETLYECGEHYTTFICVDKKSAKPTSKKFTFITYEGMIKILYSSHSSIAKTFRKWATDILFTHQMGATEKKEEIASAVLGVPVKSLRAVLKTSTRSVPCIYMFSLGTAQNLRATMSLPAEIPDDSTIIKYGFTDDLVRRAAEHVRTYEKYQGVKLGLMNFTYIDPKHLQEAENHVREFFRTIEKPIRFEKFAELVAVEHQHTDYIKKQFSFISKEFAGNIAELNAKVDKLERDNKELIKEIHHAKELRESDLRHYQDLLESKDKDIKIRDKDIELRDKDIELRDKDIENLKLKLEIASIQPRKLN